MCSSDLLRSPEMVKAFDQMRLMVSKYMDPAIAGRDYDAAINMMANGDAAFFIMGDWAIGNLKAAGYKPGEDILCQQAPTDWGKAGFILNADSVVFFTQGVWHWQGDRTEPGDRVTLHWHFNRGILRSLEPKKVDVQMLHRNAPRLGEMLGEDDWFDKMTAQGRDHVRLMHMQRLLSFNEKQKRAILEGVNENVAAVG